MRASAAPDTLRHLAVELAVGAGGIVRAGHGRRLEVLTKSTPTDMVTAVDREVEAWLSGQIAERRPDDAILGEEGPGLGGSSGVRWVVDPIDGTVNFVLGLPEYAVSVAAEVDGLVVAGCVHNPATGEVFHAMRSDGAYLGDSRLHGPREVPLERAVIGTGFGYDAGRRAAQGRIVAALLPRIADIRRIGSASLDLCAVAAGRLDGYYEVGLHPWDWSAGVLIAEEAGCRASGLRGRAVGDGVTAVAGAGLADEFFALLEELGADVA